MMPWKGAGTMKRKKRNPERFDPIELFTAIGRDLGYTLDTEGRRDFLGTWGLSEGIDLDPSMLHGKRAEAMFAHVAGAMGRCRLIKRKTPVRSSWTGTT